MGPFKELSAEKIWKTLEGQKDVLSGEMEKEASLFRQASCPQCQAGQMSPFIDPKKPFSPASPLPKKLLRCLRCGCEFNPTTGFITKAGLSLDEVDPLSGG